MEDSQTIKAEVIKSRALTGLRALSIRMIASQILRIISSLCLSRLLFPSDYGLFSISAYIVGLGMYLGDIGLSAALVREEGVPTDDEAITVFLCHQILTAIIVGTLIIASHALVHLYRLPSHASLMVCTMAIGLFLTSLRIIPMMMLERHLHFKAVAQCELIENIVQTVTTIVLAWFGWGAWALAGGGLIRGTVGLVFVWIASPWRPAGRFSFSLVRKLASFGLAFQLNVLAPTLMGGWMPFIVGRLLGSAAVGFVSWASAIASTPLVLSSILNRIAFPTYSRLHSNPAAFGHFLRQSVRRISAILWLAIPIFVILSPLIIPQVFGSRWKPAVPLVQWLSIECVFVVLTGLLASAHVAGGQIGERLTLTLGIGVVQWILGYFATRHFGLMGIGPARCLVSFCELLISVALVKSRHTHCEGLVRDVLEPLIITLLVLGLSVGVIDNLIHHGIWLQTILALSIFLILIGLREFATGGHTLIRELRSLQLMFSPSQDVSSA